MVGCSRTSLVVSESGGISDTMKAAPGSKTGVEGGDMEQNTVQFAAHWPGSNGTKKGYQAKQGLQARLAPWASSQRVQLGAAFGLGCLLTFGLLSFSGRGGLPAPPASPLAWNPMMLPLEDKRWVQEWVRTTVPSMVKLPRRQLSMELGIGALLNGVPGDFVECGVALGGTSILLSKVLDKYDATGRRVLWAADSFEGLPDPTEQDREGSGDVGRRGEFSYAEDHFHSNLAAFGVDEGRVRVVKGWFDQTLPSAGIQRISFLRLDGDLYASTMAPLEALYDKLSPGGLVYVDDYNSFNGCKKAVDEFRAKRRITSPLQLQYIADDLYNTTAPESRWEAAWWIKE